MVHFFIHLNQFENFHTIKQHRCQMNTTLPLSCTGSKAAIDMWKVVDTVWVYVFPLSIDSPGNKNSVH